jgi:disulfide oxidoreductase YuzD
MIRTLAKIYGPAVRVEYHDLSNPIFKARAEDIYDTIKARELDYPVVTINGQIRLAGDVDFYGVIEALETERQQLAKAA